MLEFSLLTVGKFYLLLINHLCSPVCEKSSSIIQPVTRSPTDSVGITGNHHNMLQQYHYTTILKYQLQDDLLLLMQVAKNKQPQIVR